MTGRKPPLRRVGAEEYSWTMRLLDRHRAARAAVDDLGGVRA